MNEDKCPHQTKLGVVEILKDAWNDEPGKDLKIACKEGQSIKCHGLILSQVSPMINHLIKGSLNQIKDPMLFLPDFSVESLKFFLKMSYCFEVEEVEEEIREELKSLLQTLEVEFKVKKFNDDQVSCDEDNINLQRSNPCKICESRKNGDTVILFVCISCNNKIGTTISNHSTVQNFINKTNPGKAMRYQCKPCLDIKKTPFGLGNPRPDNDGKQVLICWKCGEDFMLHQELKKHLNEHNNPPPQVCNDCEMVYETKEELLEHTSIVHKTVLPKCHLCPERIPDLDVHLKLNHSGLEGKAKCNLCPFEDFTLQGISSHKKRCHGLKAKRKRLSMESLTKANGYPGQVVAIRREKLDESGYVCADCGMTFQTKDKHVEHVSSVHMTGMPKCHLCPEIVTEMKLHLQWHHTGLEGKRKCDECSYEHDSTGGITSHKKRCHGLKAREKVKLKAHFSGKEFRARDNMDKDFKIQCDQCPVACPPERFSRHMEDHHSPDLPFECNYCGFRSANVIGLDAHETRYHFNRKFGADGEQGPSKKLYESNKEDELNKGLRVRCDLCPQTCIPATLKEHTRDHHDPNLPFKCNYCEFRSLFKRGIPLHESRFHYKEKHGEEKKKALCGHGCGKSFVNVTHMRGHMKRFCPLSKQKEELVELEKQTKKADEMRARKMIQRLSRINKRKKYLEGLE